jgi:hypothetical protein
MAMEIDHPLLLIGIGGTGGRIGQRLEKRLRDEIRGPDGERPFGSADRGHLPYELPACFQFLYLDIDENDLGRLKNQVPGHEQAVARTMRTASKLLPSHRSYAQVAQFLHLKAEEQVREWLPPAEGEPKVAPLANGAGQLPTVGRACLFARIAEAGLGAAQEPVTEAIERLRNCSTDLAALGGLNSGVCDVFVAFSVAGGTGNGMFYDYIHLVADAFRNTGIAIQIYPLVVMPSFFAEGAGGGRNAMLNAGRGLLDLSRLIDDQNMRDADAAFRTAGAQRATGHSVTYRDRQALKVIQIEPSTTQTAFLFSRTAALTEASFNESIVSFVLSMAGVRSEASAQDGPKAGAQSSFINQGVDRQALSASGIGGCGMSTAAVASLTAPRARITSLFARRLLAEAIARVDRVPPGENNEALLDTFFHATGLTDLVGRPHLGSHQAEQLSNAKTRGLKALQEHDDHKAAMDHRVAVMADQFAPMLKRGVAEVASQPEVDPFRTARVMTTVDGFLRMNPANFPMPGLSGKPSRGEVRSWLDASAHSAWVAAWAAQAANWTPPLARTGAAAQALAGALREFQKSTSARFGTDVGGLFEDHATTRHFLHNLPRDGDGFYDTLFSRLAESLQLRAADPLVLLTALLGKQRPWESLIIDATGDGRDATDRAWRAVARFLDRVSERIADRMSHDNTILPQLRDLISPDAARGDLAGADAIISALRGLVPTGLLMTAAGPARVLITYPVLPVTIYSGTEPAAGAPSGSAPGDGPQIRRNTEVERFLQETIAIGAQAGDVLYEFRPTAAEILTVVLMRTALGVTDIPEAREVMSLWADALREGDINDALRWRQRLGYDYAWLLTTESQRVNILQRLLIAMRNGQVQVLSGEDKWPRQIAIQASSVPDSSAARLELPLHPWDEASPWADLLHAYEESILAGDELNRQAMYNRLMLAKPAINPETGKPADPSDLYQTFLKVTEEEVQKLKALRARQLDTDQRLRVDGLLDFWTKTVLAAREKKIQGYSGMRNTLKALDEP